MRPGYKQTEVGLIPEDWDDVQIGELGPFVTSGSRGWAPFYSEFGALFVRITNLSRDTIYVSLSDSKFVRLPYGVGECARTQLRPGDVLISITADIGIVGYVDLRVPSPAYINQHIALIRFDPSKIDGKFVSYFLASENPQRRFRASTDTGAKAGMNLSTVQKIRIALPSPDEQRAIASALSDVDALLDGLDRLISKKRDLKQAAMQQLFTGRTRLPGYHGKWEVKQLGELAALYQPETISERRFTQSGYPVYGANGVVGFFNRANHERWQVTVTCRGSTCGTVNRAIAPCWITGNAMVLNCDHNAKLDKTFFYYLVLSQDFTGCITGTGQPQIVRGPLAAFNVVLPSERSEQVAIASILSDVDAELDALEARHEKTRALKHGMMQVLLTGRTRLVKPEPVEQEAAHA